MTENNSILMETISSNLGIEQGENRISGDENTYSVMVSNHQVALNANRIVNDDLSESTDDESDGEEENNIFEPFLIKLCNKYLEHQQNYINKIFNTLNQKFSQKKGNPATERYNNNYIFDNSDIKILGNQITKGINYIEYFYNVKNLNLDIDKNIVLGTYFTPNENDKNLYEWSIYYIIKDKKKYYIRKVQIKGLMLVLKKF